MTEEKFANISKEKNNEPLNEYLDRLLTYQRKSESPHEESSTKERQVEKETVRAMLNNNSNEAQNYPTFDNNSNINIKNGKYLIKLI